MTLKPETIGILAMLLGAKVTGFTRSGVKFSNEERFGIEVRLSNDEFRVLWVDGDVLTFENSKPGEFQ
jgi:hypothetical protein